MKYRIICIISIIAMISIVCVTSFANEAIKTNTSNIITESEVNFLNEINLENEMETKNVEMNKSIIMGNSTLNLEYQENKLGKSVYSNIENKDEYIFDNGKLVGFIKEMEPNNTKVRNTIIDLEQAKKIAENFASENIDGFNNYELSYTNYIESYDEYCIVFMNELNGINTHDTIKINVNSLGEIVSYSAFHQGEFEEYENLVIDLSYINEAVLETIESKYGEQLKETETKYQFLRIIDGRLAMQNDVLIVLENATSGTPNEISLCESIIYMIE